MKKSKVVLVGKGYGWWFAPSDVPADTEIWGINDLVYQRVSLDKVFNMHLLEKYSDVDTVSTRLASELGITLVMPKAYDHLPTSEAFPLEEAIKEFGTDYFFTGIAYMFCLAIMKGFKQIDCYGINMRGDDEKYKNARACVEFWIGVAIGRGIKVNMKGKYCDCLKTIDRRLYGYTTFQTIPEDINDRALNASIIMGLDRNKLKDIHTFLNSQKSSKFHMNYRPIPLNDPDNYHLKKNIEEILWKEGDGFRYAGDIGFYNLAQAGGFASCDTDSRMVYIKHNDAEAIYEDWLMYSGEFNLWTKTDSEHWNGDKRHVEEMYFPKYDLPKKEALKKFIDEYHKIAIKVAYQYPARFKMFEHDVLDTEQGRKELLTFLGYREEDMILQEEVCQQNSLEKSTSTITET